MNWEIILGIIVGLFCYLIAYYFGKKHGKNKAWDKFLELVNRPPGAYRWTDFPKVCGIVTDLWYRHFSWGAHIIWNPIVGYQDYRKIIKMYWDKLSFSVLSPRLDFDWKKYFPERRKK